MGFFAGVEYLAGQLGMELLQREFGLLSSNLGVGHPRNLVGMPSKFLWRLGHNTARPHVLAAAKPQPVDPLFVGKTDAVQPFAHNAPAARMTRFARA
jgi:hypothetical protein